MSTQPLTPAMETGLGPCGQPCDHPCDEPCEDKAANGSALTRFFRASLLNTLDVCFDDVYQEPKKILIIGGCRQRDLAQHIALLLPAADIVLVDPDEAEARKAEKEICCRFKFVAAPLEAMPFDNEAFDLTIAHNVFAYMADWNQALGEICRVTGKNLLLSHHRPLLWKLASRLNGFEGAMRELGTADIPDALPEKFDWLTRLYLYAKIKTKLAPFPWAVYMAQMKPRWDEKLTLS